MGLLTLCAMALTNLLLRNAGVDTLAWRYTAALGVGYLVYLLLLRLWAGMLVRKQERGMLDYAPDANWMPSHSSHASSASDAHGAGHSPMSSGQGGDFGGGGADGGWDGSAADILADQAGSSVGDFASGALEVAAGADEGAIVVVPVVAVFLAAVAVLLGAGWLALAWFGTEALLTAAVELAFVYTAARTVVRVEREGWLLAAVRLTWKPLLGALVCAALLGLAIDHFMPQAGSLPEAIRLWRGH
jgi:hypothetical protein